MLDLTHTYFTGECAKSPTETLQNLVGPNFMLMSMNVECKVPVGVMIRCPNTFIHIVYLGMNYFNRCDQEFYMILQNVKKNPHVDFEWDSS